jgi:hypothetical protein
MSETPAVVEKLMALTLPDFHRSLKALAPDAAIGASQTALSLPVEGGRVKIEFTALEKEVLGGLLAMPRARVILTFDGTGKQVRTAFLARFDQAFQRGGG